MKVLIIPSWYPSEAYPTTGIFFKDQATLLAKKRPDWQIGISTWGSHDPRLWLKVMRPLDFILKTSSKLPLKPMERKLECNLVEFFSPAFTWSRYFFKGNLPEIIDANRRNLDRFIKHFGRPDVIHAQVSFPAGHIAKCLSQESQIPYMISEHMSPFPLPSLAGILNSKIIPALRGAVKVHAVSEHLLTKLKHFGVSASLISNFVDDDFFDIPAGKTCEPNHWLTIGRLETQKGYEWLLDELSEVKKGGVHFSMHLAGTGSLQASLKKRAERLNLSDRIIFHGDLGKAQLRSLMWQCSAFISTSVHENQPVSILEVLACGLPVISTDWEGVTGLVNSKNGLILSRTTGSLSNSLLGTDLGQWSPELIRSDFESRFSSDKVIDRLTADFREIAN